MKGDFSRSSFDPLKHYRGVRLQQGRVQLDADWNEQVDILLHDNARDLKDLLGAHGVPASAPGFSITLPGGPVNPAPGGQLLPPDVQIAKGQRYVDGILCRNEVPCTFTTQPDFPGSAQHSQEFADKQKYLVYLDVWQHHVTAHEDPDIREVALEGLDTTTRIKTVSQVKFWPLPSAMGQTGGNTTFSAAWQAFIAEKQKARGKLCAWKAVEGAIPQNQLYRIEIHSVEKNGRITFKWSRENGAVAYSVLKIEVNSENSERIDIRLKDVMRDQLDLQIKDWVEIGSNDDALDGAAGVFGTVIDIQPDLQKIIVQPVLGDQSTVQAVLSDEDTCDKKRMVLQGWDQRESEEQPLDQGTLTVTFDRGMTLENGLQVKFSPGVYSVGDYWLVPARANLNQGTGGVLWPPDESKPPAGIEHHYAPLAVLHYVAGQWQLDDQYDSEDPHFRTLPMLTTEVDDLTGRVTIAEQAILDLQARVTAIKEQVDKILAYMAIERTHLFRDFKSTVELEKGDVVAMDPDTRDHVLPASSTNARLVVGVVTDIVAGDFPYRVSLQGTAHCKVIGPVKAGALLTPAERDGHARQGGWYLRPGTIIGKALRSHMPDKPEDVDKIDVLITLT